MTKLRADIGALAKSEEDVLTFAMFPDIGRKFLEERAAGTLTPEVLLPIPEAGSVAKAGGEGVPTNLLSMCMARRTGSTSPAWASRPRASATST